MAVPLSLLAALALTVAAGVPSASAQDCASAIERLDTMLQAAGTGEPLPGPSRQSGEVAKEQPQHGKPEGMEDDQPGSDRATAGRSATTETTGSDVAEEQPQSGDPADAGTPATRQSAVAEEQPQYGNPADRQEDLSSGDRRRLVALRDQARQAFAQGNEQACMAAVQEAEALVGADMAVQD